MKYYIYISNRKVDMMYPQIPQKLRESLGARIGINLGVIQTEWSEEPKQKALEDKVRIIQEYLLNEEGKKVCSLTHISDSTKPYFYAKTMEVFIAGNDTMYYSGIELDEKIINFVGSGAHIIGGSNLNTYGGSDMHSVYSAVSFLIKKDDKETLTRGEKMMSDWVATRPVQGRKNIETTLEKAFYQASWGTEGFMPLPQQEVEILGRVLYRSDKCILITPIFVAYTN